MKELFIVFLVLSGLVVFLQIQLTNLKERVKELEEEGNE